jgi:transcriptional regulator with XRE-family HTH domain
MTAHTLRDARRAKGWGQVEAARRLGLSQPYLAMLESGQRRLTPALVHRVVKTYRLPSTAVPPGHGAAGRNVSAATLAKDLAGLGYPGYAYLRSASWRPKNPGEILLSGLAHDDLEARLVEALPWVVLRYHNTLDRAWVVREAKVHDLQNRLGFVVNLARHLADRTGNAGAAHALAALERELERSRLAREDTLCRESLPQAERRWLAEHRPEEARHWNLLTDWTADALRYAA